VSPIKGKTTEEGRIIKQTTIFKQYGKGKNLPAAEKREIVECLGQGMKTLEYFLKTFKRDHRTGKRFVSDSEHTRVRADKGTMRKVSARQMHRIKRAAAEMPLQSSKRVFEAAGAAGVS